jgi:hypothetical protein
MAADAVDTHTCRTGRGSLYGRWKMTASCAEISVIDSSWQQCRFGIVIERCGTDRLYQLR